MKYECASNSHYIRIVNFRTTAGIEVQFYYVKRIENYLLIRCNALYSNSYDASYPYELGIKLYELGNNLPIFFYAKSRKLFLTKTI